MECPCQVENQEDGGNWARETLAGTDYCQGRNLESPARCELKMICAALQAAPAISRKPSANQRANQAQINAQIIFPRTSVTSEMTRKPFCQLRKPFQAGAQTILPHAQVILPRGANHFDEDQAGKVTPSAKASTPSARVAAGHSARQALTRRRCGGISPATCYLVLCVSRRFRHAFASSVMRALGAPRATLSRTLRASGLPICSRTSSARRTRSCSGGGTRPDGSSAFDVLKFASDSSARAAKRSGLLRPWPASYRLGLHR
jgi:hypothetical protein